MQYKVILSHKAEGGYEVSAPFIPHWRVWVQTRDEGIAKARKAIADFINRSEIISIDVPMEGTDDGVNNIPWEWFGSGQQDPSWGQIFDEIEEARDATRQPELTAK